MYFLKIISLLSFLMLINCSVSVDTEQKLVNITIDKKLLLRLVNDLRTKGCKCGKDYFPPVAEITWNETLEAAALNHSKDMAKHNYFSHKGKDGSMTDKRIERLGYVWMSYGENIYRTSGYSATEAEVIKAWLESPGHCSNLMGKQFKEMGIAKYNDYWTQVFATPMPTR